MISDIILKAYESIMAYVIFKFVAGVMERIVEQNLLYDFYGCLFYTYDAADERSSVDLCGARLYIKKKNE